MGNWNLDYINLIRFIRPLKEGPGLLDVWMDLPAPPFLVRMPGHLAGGGHLLEGRKDLYL